jgi:hypothetical protein
VSSLTSQAHPASPVADAFSETCRKLYLGSLKSVFQRMDLIHSEFERRKLQGLPPRL